ncbi:MAG: nicotinamide-nucleotide amidohydrolase family protein [Gammaproteobacteria bacterium]|nr:nicotinamide-nucleotide amidohydrolase family protein [Gammaproteobacteria bacterium]
MDELARAAQYLAELLSARGWRIATAESCTGGLIAKILTDAAGSSRWFERGFVTYANEAKVEMLGVAVDTLSHHGAVSEATVREMAAGALRHSHADVAVAVSGIAGPSGGSVDKPVGLVWLGFAVRDAKISVQRHQFTGDRDAVRQAAALAALEGLVALLRDG